MASKFLNLAELKVCIRRQSPIEAKDFMDDVSRFFDKDLSKVELEFAIDVFFNEEAGTVGFLKESIKERKMFKDCNVMIFDLWIKILQHYGQQMNFDSYTEAIIECCMQYIVSTIVSAKEKEKSCLVLHEIFLNQMLKYDQEKVIEIVGKLLNIFNMKDPTEMFLQHMLKLLGIVAKISPEVIAGTFSNKIRDIFLKKLEDIVLNEETVKYRMLTGAMEGLNLFLINFAPSRTEDEITICKRIYTCVKKLSDPSITGDKQKSLFRASLDLFTNHGTLFSEEIFRDFKYWYELLTKHWLSSNVYEDRRMGIYAINSFHNIVAIEINQNGCENYKHILEFLIKNFRKILESTNSSSHEMRIAIRGFGLLSGACKATFPEHLNDILSLVIQRTELVSLLEDNELRDSLEHFPDYIEALSQMAVQIKDESIVQMLIYNIRNISIRLIKDFHYLSRAHTGLVVNSLCSAFYNISKVEGIDLDDLMEKIVTQGVIWTCSRKLVYDAITDFKTDIDWKDNITYKNYLPFWQGLIEEVERSSFNRPLIAHKVFNSLMTTLFFILERLNLRTKRRVFADEEGNDQEFFFCDPNIDLCPARPADFHIFFNLVDFYRDIFWSKFRREYFREWIDEYCMKMIESSLKNPLVSGFLKLLEVGLSAANYLRHFDDNEAPWGGINASSGGVSRLLKAQLKHFLEHLIIKSQKVTGELQVACIELILKYPVSFHRDSVSSLTPIFDIAFDLGKNMIWLSKLALNCLEKISEELNYCDDDEAECDYANSVPLGSFYAKVLPNLDGFLRSKGVLEEFLADLVKYSSATRRRIRKGTIEKVTETELLTLQKKIMSYLGKLDPQIAGLVVTSNRKEFKENLVKWDINQNIKIVLNFVDVRPDFYLDTIIPRVCNLALTSSDRKTKIAACELIHATILYLLGTRKHTGQIWQELCTIMLQLGCDSDNTVQEMFEPLLTQVTHLLSRHENLWGEGADTLLDTLFEGVSNRTNCSLRDLSASCLREYVEWSIKQTRPEQLAASPLSIERILVRVKMFSLDSDGAKRTGAALAFNNLYRKLREEELVCDIFFVDLLYTFCLSFKLTEELSTVLPVDTDSDMELIGQSLDHVVRVLKGRDYLYNKENPRRKLPVGVLKKGTLQEIVIFLLQESGSKLMKYRHKCVEMVETLVTHIPGNSSLSIFLQRYILPDEIRSITECEKNQTGIRSRPTLQFIQRNSPTPHVQICSWLEHFLCSLDTHCWLLGNNGLLNPEEILINENSIIIPTITYYFEKVCWTSIVELIENVNEGTFYEDVAAASTVAKIALEEINKIEIIKCIIIVRIIDFLLAVMENKIQNELMKEFWLRNSENLQKLFKQIIFEPDQLNFDFKCEEISRKLPERVEKFLTKTFHFCKELTFLEDFRKSIINTLKVNIKHISDRMQEILNSDRISIHQMNLIRGIIFICKNIDLFSPNEIMIMYLKASARKLVDDLFYGLEKVIFGASYAHHLQQDVRKFGNQIMRFCFIVDDNIPEQVINFILNSTEVNITGTDGMKITKGEHFYNSYKKVLIHEFCVKHVERTLQIFFQNFNENNFHLITKILINLIEFIQKNATKLSEENSVSSGTNFVDLSLVNIPKLLEIFDNKKESLLFIEFITELTKINPYTSVKMFSNKAPIITKWILHNIHDKNLTLEQKSKVITLLPLIIDTEDQERDEVTKALEEFQVQKLPLRSSEFAKNSLEETGLKSVFTSLLSALMHSKSYVIFEFIIKATAADSDHILEWMIKDELEMFMTDLKSDQQIELLSKIFKLLLNDEWEPNIRHTIFQRFMMVLMKNAFEESLIQFYVDNIKMIKTLIETNYGFDKGGFAVEQALMNRIIGFSLIELMAGCLSRDTLNKLKEKDSPIFSALFPEEKNKPKGNIIGILTKNCFKARTEVFVSDNKQTKELFRIYQCAAYRAMCSLICNAQKDISLYTTLIFGENANRNEYLWRRVIDCDSKNTFILQGQEFERMPRIKEKFTSIRRLNPSLITGRNTVSGLTSNLISSSSKYLQTQNVFQSSLSQDVSKIDLNYTTVRTEYEMLTRKQAKSREILSVQLERHSINNHELMPILCGVIQHIYENKITSFPARDPGAGTSENRTKSHDPEWVRLIVQAMENIENHKNIRIFLAQLIDNNKHVFEHFASLLFRPILSVLSDECENELISIFVTDLISLLLSWSSKNLHKPTSMEEQRLASNVLKLFMKNCWNEKQEIFKYNLELIQTMISLWKNEILIPHQLLLEMITRTQRNDSRENECGIVLVGVVLASGLIPWIDVKMKYFISAVYTNLSNDFPSIYQNAAQVYGIILNKLKTMSSTTATAETIEIKEYEEKIITKLKTILNSKRDKSEKTFMKILYGVQKSYPEILNSFYSIISFKIPGAIGGIKKIYLEMLLICLETYEEDGIFDTLVSIGIKDLLKKTEYQLLALHIVNRAVAKMNAEQIMSFLPSIEFCVDSTRTECRDIVYEIFIFISLNFHSNSILCKKANLILLKGLSDSEIQIQKRIYKFWSKESNLPRQTIDRIISLISNYYNKESEKYFLSFCTHMILEAAIDNTNIDEKIFDASSLTNDNDYKLSEYKIDTISRTKSTYTLPPLFASSMAGSVVSAASGTVGGTGRYSQKLMNFLRQTNVNEDGNYFKPTLEPSNLMESHNSFTLPSQISLPFDIAPQVLDRRSHKVSSSVQKQTTETENKSTLDLRRRFLKGKEKEDREKILKVIDYRQMKKERMLPELRKKQSQVILYRRYRFGDYPDLEITPLALLLPLQGLVKRDPLIARQVLVSILNALMEKFDESAQRSFLISVSENIRKTLDNLKSCESTLFATFLEIALIRSEYFDFKPETIALISKENKMLTNGIIYLEDSLTKERFDDSSEPPEPKRTKTSSFSSVKESIQCWLHLSDIYNSLAEHDIVASIFSDKMEANRKLSKAIELKSNCDYPKAQELLLDVIRDENSIIEQYHAYNSYYDCCADLGDWSLLSQTLEQQVDDDEEYWTDDYNKTFLLPKLMQSQVQLILNSALSVSSLPSSSEKFLEFIESWMKDPLKSDYMKTTFCEELMMLHIANRKFHESRVHAESYVKNFLVQWNIISSLYKKLRLQNLLNAQKVAEIDNYALMLIEDLTEQSLDALTVRWSKCKINNTDSLRFWNSVITYRRYISSFMVDNLESAENQGSIRKLRNCIQNMNLQFLNAALYQNNYGLSEKILEQLKPLENNSRNEKYFQYQIGLIKQRLLRGKRVEDKNDKIIFFEQAWIHAQDLLNTEDLGKYIDLNIETFQLHSEICESVFKLITTRNFDLPEMMEEKLQELTDTSKSSNLFERIYEVSLSSLKNATNLCSSSSENGEQDDQNHLKNVNLIGLSYYKLAQFCYDSYNNFKSNEYSFEISNSNIIELEKLLIHAVFRGMNYNSKESKQLFPCILQIQSINDNGNDEIGSEIKEYFKKESINVPDWMFLPWISQILSRIDFSKSSFLDNILKKLTVSYPNAIRYPFNVWLSEMKAKILQNKEKIFIIRDELQFVQNTLKNPLYEKFVESFKTFCIPEILLITHIEELLKRLRNPENIFQEDYQNLIDNLIKNVFHNSIDGLQGTAYRKIAKYENIIRDKLRDLNFQRNMDCIRTTLSEIIKHLREMAKKTERKYDLEKICPWLVQFHWCGEENYLELPGQYFGNKQPHVQNHIKIFKVERYIEVLKSLRYPLKIKIYGNDAKSYEYLIKYGEDLKQDQRIQQILNLMSEKLLEDRNCRNHNLFIQTYNVIPILKICGMLTWVQNTIDLQDFVLRSYVKREPQGEEYFKNAYNEYENFIRNASENVSVDSGIMYGEAAMKYTLEDIINNFKRMETIIDLDILKFGIIDTSVSPESFYVLRNNYATSLAAMSIAHYILGIGDRHLSNIKFNVKDGTLTGVDFNCTFGSGTRNLQVPELIPFRLTPHMVHAMSPMGISGVIKKSMIHALRVFRNNAKILLACMEVFIREPNVDWLEILKKPQTNEPVSPHESSGSVNNTTTSNESESWEPKHRIEIANRKLQGYDPVNLLEIDLKSGIISSQRYNKYLSRYLEILYSAGTKDDNQQTEEISMLTVEEQVNHLIKIATYPGILGIAYRGLSPWI